MATSLATIRQRVEQDQAIGFASTTTADGAATNLTLEDSTLADYTSGELANKWVMVTSGTASGEIRRVSTNSDSTLTVTRAFSAKIVNGVTYEISSIKHDFLKDKINVAILASFPELCQTVLDITSETVVDDQFTYDVPATIKGDPLTIAIYDSDDDDENEWTQVGNWHYDPVNHTVTFDWQFTEDCIIRFEGINSLSAVTTDASTTEVDAPNIEYLYTLVSLEIARWLARQETGSKTDRFQKEVQRLETLAYIQKDKYRMPRPQRTKKDPQWYPGK